MIVFKKLNIFIFFSSLLLLSNCASVKYSSGNIDIGNAKTFQVNRFENSSNLVEPGINNNFTQSLQDLILNQTGLTLVNSNGDLVYEGEITEYRISPTTSTSNNTAAQNRLTITVNVHFLNKEKDNTEFEKPFTFFYDFPGNQLLTGTLKNTVHKEIFNQLTHDIINTSLSNW